MSDFVGQDLQMKSHTTLLPGKPQRGQILVSRPQRQFKPGQRPKAPVSSVCNLRRRGARSSKRGRVRPASRVICKAIPAGVILLTAKMNLGFIGLLLLPAEDLAETNTRRTLAQCRGSRTQKPGLGASSGKTKSERRERGGVFVF